MKPRVDRLLLFTRYPQIGTTKTRLIPHLGAHQAAALQRRMTEFIVATLSTFQKQSKIPVEVHFADGSLAAMQNWLGPDLTYVPQVGGDLGRRLRAAVSRNCASQGATVIIGADCPAVTSIHLQRAFTLLQTHDLVLGPAHDGGYYLIGLNRPCADLFQDIHWGTPDVFLQTVAIASRLNLTIATLEALPDIDRPEDLPRLPDALMPG